MTSTSSHVQRVLIIYEHEISSSDSTTRWGSSLFVNKHIKYIEPSLQRQPLFPKTLKLKWICYCTEYSLNRLKCKKGLVLFLFPLIEHMFWIFVQIYKTCFFKALNTIFLHNLWLAVTSYAKVSWQSNCHYNKYCRCIECRYKEGCLYCRISWISQATRMCMRTDLCSYLR